MLPNKDMQILVELRKITFKGQPIKALRIDNIISESQHGFYG